MFFRIYAPLLISLLSIAACADDAPRDDDFADASIDAHANPRTRPSFPTQADTRGAWTLEHEPGLDVHLSASEGSFSATVDAALPNEGGTIDLPEGKHVEITCGGAYLCPNEIMNVGSHGALTVHAVDEIDADVALDLTAQRSWCDDPTSPMPTGSPSTFLPASTGRPETFYDGDGIDHFSINIDPAHVQCWQAHNCFARPYVITTVVEYETLPDSTRRATELDVLASVTIPTRCIGSDIAWGIANNSSGFTTISTRYAARRP